LVSFQTNREVRLFLTHLKTLKNLFARTGSRRTLKSNQLAHFPSEFNPGNSDFENNKVPNQVFLPYAKGFLAERSVRRYASKTEQRE
jgi:hypothetical protein